MKAAQSARVAILISGGGSNMVSLAQAVSQSKSNSEVCLVLSNNPKAAGLDKARALGLETECVSSQDFPNDRNGFEAALHTKLSSVKPDVICLAGFMSVLSADFVSKWPEKILNIHPSLLPKYKGLNTHKRALEAQDLVHGCSVHEVTDKLDDGPVLGQAHVPVYPGDTVDTLAKRVLEREHVLYPAVLERFLSGQKAPLILEK